MKIGFPERLIFVINMSIKTGAVFSCFEGAVYYLTFPLGSVPGLVDLFARNILVFLAVGSITFFLLSIAGRLFEGISVYVIPGVLSALILFPLYFFLVSLLEGTGLIYRYLDDPKVAMLLITSPVVLLFLIFSKFFAGDTTVRYWRLVCSAFLFAGWRLLTRSELPGYLYLLIFPALAIVMYFIVSRIQGWFSSAVDPGSRRPRLRAPLVFVLFLGILYLLLHMFQGRWVAGSFRSLDRPSVLLIVLDTARADRLSCYGYRRDTTPFLRSLGTDATVYDGAVAPAPWTVPSHASIFTGLYPSAHGSTWMTNRLDKRFLTLPEFLSEKGYTTAGFCNNPAVNVGNGLAQGFDTFVEVWQEKVMNPTLFHRIEWFLRRLLKTDDGGALRTNQWIIEWLQRVYRGDRPFFLFVNLMESHLWHDAPQKYHEMYLEEELSETIKQLHPKDLYPILTGYLSLTEEEWQEYGDIYDGDLFYLDGKLEELYRTLEEYFFLENTIVVITSDHGEHLGEHGMIDHMLSLYEPLIRIPLIIKVPGRMNVQRGRGGDAELLDIYPTLVNLLGLEAEAEGMNFQGRSLAGEGPAARDFTIAEHDPPKERIYRFLEDHPGGTAILKYDRTLRSIRADSIKYIWSSNGDSELYDLSADPGETRNLIEERGEEAMALEGKLTDWLTSFEHAGEPEGEMELDPETRNRLKALGYIE